MTSVTVEVQTNKLLIDYISDKAEVHFWGMRDIGHSRKGKFILQNHESDTRLVVKSNRLILKSPNGPLSVVKLSERDANKIKKELRKIA